MGECFFYLFVRVSVVGLVDGRIMRFVSGSVEVFKVG